MTVGRRGSAPMALGLLTVHALGLAALAVTCFGGFGADSLAGHIWAGLISVLLVVFAHTMSTFYFVAMTSVIRKALAGGERPAGAPGTTRGARSCWRAADGSGRASPRGLSAGCCCRWRRSSSAGAPTPAPSPP